MKVVIVYSASGRGLARDAELLRSTISELGTDVSVVRASPQPAILRELSFKYDRLLRRLPWRQLINKFHRWQRSARRLISPLPGDISVVIHLENIHPHYILKGRENWLVPNQEWFRTSRLHYLADITRVLCKTEAGLSVFKPLHPAAHYLGFSIPGANLHIPESSAACTRSGFIHVSGSSLSKGTAAVLDAWQKHPEWPELRLVANSKLAERPLPPNVTHYRNISDEELTALWQTSRFAVIPSEVEGYGQVLGEAMKAGAVLITTDAPPMNELVSPDRGYLVPFRKTQPFRLGTRYYVYSDDLVSVITSALNDTPQVVDTKGKAASAWVLSNHTAFKQRLSELMSAADTIKAGNETPVPHESVASRH